MKKFLWYLINTTIKGDKKLEFSNFLVKDQNNILIIT